MNFKVFKCYIYVCNLIEISPSWDGFERYTRYLEESENNGRY